VSWLPSSGLFGRSETRSESELAAEVRAEIEHHLACKTRELIEQGVAPEDAVVEALRRFGDVAGIERACVRVHTRERIMLQRVHLAFTGILLVALGWLAQANHRAGIVAAEAEKAAHDMKVNALHMLGQIAARPTSKEIVIEVGDELEILDRYGQQEVAGKQVVAADGKILLPDTGWLFVEGMTREQAEQAITAALAPYFVEVQVYVRVHEPSLDLVTLDSTKFEGF